MPVTCGNERNRLAVGPAVGAELEVAFERLVLDVAARVFRGVGGQWHEGGDEQTKARVSRHPLWSEQVGGQPTLEHSTRAQRAQRKPTVSVASVRASASRLVASNVRAW